MDPPLGPLRCIFVHTGKIGSVTDYFDTIIKACHSHARVIVAKAILCIFIYILYKSVSMCTKLILHIISSYRRRKKHNRRDNNNNNNNVNGTFDIIVSIAICGHIINAEVVCVCVVRIIL